MMIAHLHHPARLQAARRNGPIGRQRALPARSARCAALTSRKRQAPSDEDEEPLLKVPKKHFSCPTCTGCGQPECSDHSTMCASAIGPFKCCVLSIDESARISRGEFEADAGSDTMIKVRGSIFDKIHGKKLIPQNAASLNVAIDVDKLPLMPKKDPLDGQPSMIPWWNGAFEPQRLSLIHI